MNEYYMLNKPKGLLTAKTDLRVPTVMECFPKDMRERIHPIGRLDKDTEGLLIFTNDGMLDNALMQPGMHVRKKYFFYALGEPNMEKLEKLKSGVQLYGNDKPASLPAKIEFCYFSTVWKSRDLLPDFRKSRYLKNPDGCICGGYAEITEGKKHQVKLMLQYAGCKIFYLKRVSVGCLVLDESLKAGEYKKLTDDDLRLLLMK